ncbi:ABC transporter permease [Flavobacterium selenitireducens]|uniref:ABC transporter permease n=1 Tax=Flavobacterium selenitireducens TaxID=2722704 RepID=UPI00168BAF51|nr:FtsX-like permease family protein [Flavobacterium selenitireducens]MBD3583237.1 ABC transporter permease [Flavobacterium selenitireducens]
MNLEYFIAKRLIAAKGRKSTISAPIIKIAVTAIAIGMVMMILSVATGIGLQQKIREKVSAFNGHIIISNYDDNQSEVSSKPISTRQDFYPKFKGVTGIEHVQAVASKAGIIRTADAFEGIIFKGVGKDYAWKNLDEFLLEGKLPNVSAKLNDEVIVSRFLADRLKLKLGDRFNTFFMKEGEGNQKPNLRVFRIVGIYASGLQEFDATYILGDIRHLQRINKWRPDQVGSFEVFVRDFTQIEQKGREVYESTFDATDPTAALDTKTIIEKYYYIFDWLQLFDFNILVILVVMILVATINMVVALLVIILERTQMIGILKSLGTTNWSVRKVFLYNASYIIVRGLLWGNTIGILLVVLQQQFGLIKLNPENYYVSVAPVYFSFGYILLLNLGTMLICLLVLLLPSYIITKISPVRAIRFD